MFLLQNYILISSGAFVLGFLSCLLFLKLFKNNKSENKILTLIEDFKFSLEDYKKQNEINNLEIKHVLGQAAELSKVLTTNQNLKGRFGEDNLENILKIAFSNNVDYVKQFNTLNKDNEKIKPDYLINLPNNKHILIDCKLNLDKFIDYQNSLKTDLEKMKKTEFIKDLNTTINLLSQKKYETALNINQPDFILMYIPLESVLTLIYTDCDFVSVVKNAVDKNIIIVGNSSVLTSLRLVKYLWAQDLIEKNTDKILEISKNIFELMAQHSQNLYSIKQVMENSLNNFNKEFEKMTTSTKIFKLANELKNCGVEASLKRQGKKLNETEINENLL